ASRTERTAAEGWSLLLELLREQVAERSELGLSLHLLLVGLVRVPLALLVHRLDRELHLATLRVELDDLRVELLADRKHPAQLGAARRAGRGGADEPARVTTGRAEDPDYEPARIDGHDGALDDLVERNALRRLAGGVPGR